MLFLNFYCLFDLYGLDYGVFFSLIRFITARVKIYLKFSEMLSQSISKIISQSTSLINLYIHFHNEAIYYIYPFLTWRNLFEAELSVPLDVWESFPSSHIAETSGKSENS